MKACSPSRPFLDRVHGCRAPHDGRRRPSSIDRRTAARVDASVRTRSRRRLGALARDVHRCGDGRRRTRPASPFRARRSSQPLARAALAAPSHSVAESLPTESASGTASARASCLEMSRSAFPTSGANPPRVAAILRPRCYRWLALRRRATLTLFRLLQPFDHHLAWILSRALNSRRGRRCGGSLWCDSRQSERERAHRSYTPKRASCEAGCERSAKDSSCPSTHHQSPPDSQTQAAIPTVIHARVASSAPPAHPLRARSKAPSCRLRDRGSAQE